MKKQTAVEWLVEQIKSDQNQKALLPDEWMEVIEQAKAMEREQMLKLISFVRMHNKMGKSAEDLLQEFETYKGGEQ
jgi:hypothetical protein